MKTIALLSAAIVAGAVRYPTEGGLTVHDAEADRLIENGFAELVEEDEPLAEENEGNLDDLKVEELRKLAEDEKIDLGDATKKADIIAAIELHRAG